MSNKTRVAIPLFLILCALPLPLWTLMGGTSSGELEKRELAPLPDFRLETIETFPSEVENYFNDRLPFRGSLIWANSALEYTLLNTSSNSNVIIGKDGWLFYKKSVDQDLGRVMFTEQELERIVQNMQAVQSFCNDRGITFVLFIAPNKERMYSDYIPESYGQMVERGQFEQVITCLEERTDVTVIHPDDVLANWRKTHSEPVGYLTDTHWNSLGGYLGASALLAALGKETSPLLGITVESTDTHDLADMLHLNNTIDTGSDYVPVFEERSVEKENDNYGHVLYENPQGEGKILISRDSFCEAMNRPLSQPWLAYDAVHRPAFVWGMVDEFQPDVFVFEIVERSLGDLVSLELP